MKKFNINEPILIQITEKGWQHLKEQEGEAFVKHCIVAHEQIIEGEKWYKLQAHQVISLFGSATFSTFGSPIKSNILIP